METTPLDYADSLAAELSKWQRQQQLLMEYGSAKDLQTRRFMRMKLKVFDRLWIKYRGGSSHPDREALLRVVAFQRKEMEAALYPGLAGWLRKMLHRARVEAFHKVTGTREQPVYHQAYPEAGQRDYPSRTPQGTGQQQGNNPGEGQGHKRSTDLEQFKGWDYGGKKQNNPGKGIGL